MEELRNAATYDYFFSIQCLLNSTAIAELRDGESISKNLILEAFQTGPGFWFEQCKNLVEECYSVSTFSRIQISHIRMELSFDNQIGDLISFFRI